MKNCLSDQTKVFNLTISVKFMSGQFDGFLNQLLEIMNTTKELKEENKRFKEKHLN